MNGRREHSGSRTWHVVGAWVVAALAGSVACGQTVESLAIDRTYGSGVHAYFTGDFDRSYDDLTAAIEAGSEDPRTRYFRGLSALRLGRLDEAEADFSEGAELEARSLGGWPVSRSLERVQGHDRLRLERYRARARVALVQRDRAAERERYSAIEDAQPEVLRRRRPVELPPPTEDSANPFVDRPAPRPDRVDSVRPDSAPEIPTAQEPAVGGDAVAPEMEQPAPTDDAPAPEPAAADDPFGGATSPEMEVPAEPLPGTEAVPAIEGQ